VHDIDLVAHKLLIG